MSYYARLRLVLEADDYATYPDPRRHSINAALTPDERRIDDHVDAGANGAAFTYNMDAYTTVTAFVVHNVDSGAANVTVTYTDTSANVCAVILPGGGVPLVTPDIDPAVDPTFESADATAPRLAISITGT